MRIAAVCMMKNEEVLAESAVRYWLTFCDLVIVYDHYSTDGTSDILGALQEEYAERLILYKPDFPVSFEWQQKEITNAMIREAFLVHRADMVLPLDADEFPYVSNRGTSVRDLLSSLNLHSCYRVSSVPYALPQENGGLDTSRLLPLSFRFRKRPLFLQTPKCILTRSPYLEDTIDVTMGNHDLFRLSGKDLPPIVDLSPSLYYTHYPYQSISQFKAKNAVGWLASYCNPDWAPGVSYHLEHSAEQMISGEPVTADRVNWNIFTSFGKTGESMSEIQLEEIDPSGYFPDIPLRYTERFSRKKDAFTLLLEQSLSVAEAYKKQQQALKLGQEEKDQLKAELAVQEEEKAHLLETLEKQKQETAFLREEIERIQTSRSYRLGRLATWLPRKMRNRLRKTVVK